MGLPLPFSVAFLQDTSAPCNSRFAYVYCWLILVEKSFSPGAGPCLQLSGLCSSSFFLLLILLWMRTMLVLATVIKHGQLCFGHCVSIPTVEVFQKYVIIHIKLFSCCSANKVALSTGNSWVLCTRSKGGTKVPLMVVLLHSFSCT